MGENVRKVSIYKIFHLLFSIEMIIPNVTTLIYIPDIKQADNKSQDIHKICLQKICEKNLTIQL